MSEEGEKIDSNKFQADLHGCSVDWHLQTLVNLANNAHLEIGITLLIGGGVVSGTLIGGKKYFELFGTDFSSVLSGDTKEEVRAAFASKGALYDTDESQEAPSPQYVHLMNAKIFSPTGTIPTHGGTLWRGKINSVAGFNLGSLAVEQG